MNQDTNTMPTPAYIYYAYVLASRYELARVTELFSDSEKTFNRLCELGKNCIVTMNNTIVYIGQ